jgi:hypothetical protein
VDRLTAGFYWYFPATTAAALADTVRQDICAPPYVVYVAPGRDTQGDPAVEVWQMGIETPVPFSRLPGIFFGRLFTPDPLLLLRAGQGIINPAPEERED